MDSPSQKFKLLHNELQLILKAQVFDEQLIQKKITKYIGYMVQDNAAQQQKMFDYFCEFNGVQIFSNLMIGDPLLAIKSYSLLFINLKNQMWISYILCQPFLMKAIGLQSDSRDQQYTEYFVSFLKSLSIRINSSQITLFYNKKNCTFPLVMAAMKYFNHPDFMVRTSVMNIILELMKNKQKKAQQYFSRFPFTSYLINFACEVNALITTNNKKISEQGQQKLVAKHLTSYKVDISDYLYYFNDLIQFASPKAIEVIQQTIVSYIIIPIFNWFMQQNKLAKIHALLLIHQCLRIIKSKPIIDTIVMLLFASQLNQTVITKIKLFKNVYKPQVFNRQFNVQSNYWGQYEEQIIGHCLQIFKDIQNFDVDYEESKHEKSMKFNEEINRISKFINYDILKSAFLQQKFMDLIGNKQYNINNPFKSVFIELLQSCKHSKDILTTIILNVLTNTYISSHVLQICQLSIKSQMEANQDNKFGFLKQLKNKLINHIDSMDWKQQTIITLSNNLSILKLLVQQEQNIEFEELMLQKYRQIANILKQYIIPQNMTLLVDKFVQIHKKIKQSFQRNSNELSIPYATIFMPQQKWDQSYQQFLLPVKLYKKIAHFIQHFFIFRSFVTYYFIKFYQAEYIDFQQLYQDTFSQTTKRWSKNQNYKINNRALILCFLQNKQSNKKDKKVMIIQDKLNFVLAEINEKLCTILINQIWKNMSFQISKEDGTCIDVTVNNKNGIQKYRIIFEDQLRCNTTLVRLNDIKWEYYQYELSFINKFIKNALQQ